jgi:hypothetical protein
MFGCASRFGRCSRYRPTPSVLKPDYRHKLINTDYIYDVSPCGCQSLGDGVFRCFYQAGHTLLRRVRSLLITRSLLTTRSLLITHLDQSITPCEASSFLLAELGLCLRLDEWPCRRVAYRRLNYRNQFYSIHEVRSMTLTVP